MKSKTQIFVLTILLSSFYQITFAQKGISSKTSNDNGNSTYKTSIGIRGGWTSGLTVKHFMSENAAIEGIIGARYRGINIAGLYEMHKQNALGVSRLSWEYGVGGRIGFYDGRYYRQWNKKYYYEDRSYTVVSVIGIFGLEYHFEEIPFTVGLDLMPYFDFIGRGDSFIEGSVSFRYVF